MSTSTHNVALAKRANEVLVSRGVAPSAASVDEYVAALEAAQAELGEYDSALEAQTPVAPLELRGDYMDRSYAVRAAAVPMTPEVEAQHARHLEIDQRATEIMAEWTAAKREARPFRGDYVDAYTQAEKEIGGASS
jgi:hypothetical protein